MSSLQGFRMLFAFILLLQLSCRSCVGHWFHGFFSDGKENGASHGPEFSLEGFASEKGKRLLDNANHIVRTSSPDSCKAKAYKKLLSGCSKALANEESRNRFAWELTDCFLQHTSRGELPYCDLRSKITDCLERVKDKHIHAVYLEYHLESNSICYQMQAPAFRDEIVKQVNNLKDSAAMVGGQLREIKEQGERVLEMSEKTTDSLTSLHQQSQELTDISKDVGTRVSEISKQTTLLNNRFKIITAFQAELTKGQNDMKGNLKVGMDLIHKSFHDLRNGVEKLKDENAKIEKQIDEVREKLSEKMNILQSKADVISKIAEISVDKQKEILDGQSKALDGLQDLRKMHSEALEENREAAEQMAKFVHKQQEERLHMQERLQRSHDSLIAQTKTISDAQGKFAANQSRMFLALDHIRWVVDLIRLETRIMKIIFLYIVFIIFAQVFTSTEQTIGARRWIHLHFVGALFADCFLLWYTGYDNGWIIYLNRSALGGLSVVQVIYRYFTYWYSNYALESHKRLKSLEEALNEIKNVAWPWNEALDDKDWRESVDGYLPDDVSLLQDPNYRFPWDVGGTPGKTYNLRKRHD